MRCTYCHRQAQWRAGKADLAFCHTCYDLVKRQNWRVLAHRWLLAKPEEWIDDVAAFLERTLSEEPGPIGGIDCSGRWAPGIRRSPRRRAW
jgi:hypothetical protein